MPVEEKSARAMLYNPNQTHNFEYIGRASQKEFTAELRKLRGEYQTKASEQADQKNFTDEDQYGAFIYKQIRFLARKDGYKIQELIERLAEQAKADTTRPEKRDFMDLNGNKQTNQMILGALRGM